MDLQKLLCDELARNLRQRDRPRIPAGGDLLWKWFFDLNKGRSMGPAGPSPIRFSEMLSYFQFMGVPMPIGSEKLRILQAMDAKYLSIHYAGGTGASTGPLSEISAERFDAMFG